MTNLRLCVVTLTLACGLLLQACSSESATVKAPPTPTATATATAEKLPAPYTQGKLVRLDPRFDKLIAPDTKIEKLTEGHKWVEGPAWNKKDSYLLYSDIPNNAIFKYQP